MVQSSGSLCRLLGSTELSESLMAHSFADHGQVLPVRASALQFLSEEMKADKERAADGCDFLKEEYSI